jgi:hypothetical protein
VSRGSGVAGAIAIALLAACGGGGASELDGGDGSDAALAAVDAAPKSDSGSYCSVYGVVGECIDVAACGAGYHATAGFCPGPSTVQCCTPDDVMKCDPADMPQPNVGLVEAAGQDGCPDGMLLVPDVSKPFCVDVYEDVLVKVADGTPWSPFFNPGGEAVKAVSVEAAVPQGYVSGVQAQAACAAAGKRLCTDAEWLRACRGPDGFVYPYGDTRMTGVCNDHRDVHPAVEYFGTTAPSIWSMLGNPCLNQLHDSVDRTGSRAGCTTVDGLYDMMGNLHEWTADPAGTFRGGYYVDTVINGDGCLYATTAHDTGHWDYSTGFRCCADGP